MGYNVAIDGPAGAGKSTIAKQVAKELDKQGVRATIDNRNEKIGRKVRDNEMKRIPYMVIVGEKEQADGTVSVRKQGSEERGVLTIADFAKKINDEVAEMLKATDVHPE